MILLLLTRPNRRPFPDYALNLGLVSRFSSTPNLFLNMLASISRNAHRLLQLAVYTEVQPSPVILFRRYCSESLHSRPPSHSPHSPLPSILFSLLHLSPTYLSVDNTPLPHFHSRLK
ncbi:unnamed protein product [Citrullus colocynthis]|uniref:Uncharacterized protein n=1 Tax=Citrullus colocynthis TaxID=252529 RepID=A0ABP0Z110_9ROSI